MLKIEHISKTFNPGTVNEKQAIKYLSLELEKGDFATIIGSNGACRRQLLLLRLIVSLMRLSTSTAYSLTIPPNRLLLLSSNNIIKPRSLINQRFLGFVLAKCLQF